MKRIYLVCILIQSINLYAQFIPKQIKFENIEPEWYYLPEDSNFVKNPLDPYSSPYWGRNTTSIKEYKGNILVLENSFTQSPYGGPSGLLLHMIDKLSGQVKWIHHWNEFNGLKNREDYINQNLIFNENDELLTISSCRDVDTLTYDFPKNSFYCQPSIRKINLENGNLEEQLINLQDSLLMGIGGFSQISKTILNERKDKFFTHKEITQFDTAIVNNFIIIPLNDDLAFDFNNKIVISDTSTIPFEIPQRNFNQFFTQINSNTLIVFSGDNEINDIENSPKRLNFRIVDITDRNKIVIKSIHDITNLLIYPQQAFVALNPVGYNNGFTLTQALINSENVRYSYLRWFNIEGNLIASFNNLKINNRQYIGAYPLKEIDEDLLLIAIYEQADNNQHDIIKINKSTGEMKIVKELKTQLSNKINSANIKTVLMDSFNNLYMSYKIQETTGNTIWDRTEYNQYFKFSSESLGLTTSNKEIDQVTFDIYPNPAINELKIIANEINEGIIQIYNTTGQIIKKEKFSGKIVALNISELNSGMYFLKFVSDDFKVLHQPMRFIKM